MAAEIPPWVWLLGLAIVIGLVKFAGYTWVFALSVALIILGALSIPGTPVNFVQIPGGAAAKKLSYGMLFLGLVGMFFGPTILAAFGSTGVGNGDGGEDADVSWGRYDFTLVAPSAGYNVIGKTVSVQETNNVTADTLNYDPVNVNLTLNKLGGGAPETGVGQFDVVVEGFGQVSNSTTGLSYWIIDPTYDGKPHITIDGTQVEMSDGVYKRHYEMAAGTTSQTISILYYLNPAAFENGMRNMDQFTKTIQVIGDGDPVIAYVTIVNYAGTT